jgi:hypothetical protein
MLEALIGGFFQSRAASKAADAQLKAARESNALQKQMYDQQREDLAPWREAGSNALTQAQGLLANPSAIQSDPGYQWRLQQGMQGLNNSAGGSGGVYSGRQMRNALNYGQGMATNELGAAYNRYASMAGLGQASATNSANAAGQYGQNVGDTMQNMGNARASGTIGAANSWTNALQQMYNQYQWQQALNGNIGGGGVTGLPSGSEADMFWGG